MARIAGVDLPPQKRLWVGLTVDLWHRAGARAEACRKGQRGLTQKNSSDLTEDEINRLRQAIESEGRVEGDLRKEIQMNIRRLIEIQAIAESATAAIFRFAASARTPTRAPARVRARAPSPAKKKIKGKKG